MARAVQHLAPAAVLAAVAACQSSPARLADRAGREGANDGDKAGINCGKPVLPGYEDPAARANTTLDRMQDWASATPDPARRAAFAGSYVSAFNQAYTRQLETCRARQAKWDSLYKVTVRKLTPAQWREHLREQAEAERREAIREEVRSVLREERERQGH